MPASNARRVTKKRRAPKPFSGAPKLSEVVPEIMAGMAYLHRRDPVTFWLIRSLIENARDGMHGAVIAHAKCFRRRAAEALAAEVRK